MSRRLVLPLLTAILSVVVLPGMLSTPHATAKMPRTRMPRPEATGRIRLLLHCEEKELRIAFNLQDDSASWARVI